MNEAPPYHHGTRYPFSAAPNYSSSVQDHYRAAPDIQVSVKQDEYPQGNHDDALRSSGSNFFLGISNASTNPLFSQDRFFLNSYTHSISHHQPPSPLGFSTVNGSRERSYSTACDQEPRHQIKLEPHICDALQNDCPSDHKEVGLNPESMWSGRGSEDDLVIHEHLHPVNLEL